MNLAQRALLGAGLCAALAVPLNCLAEATAAAADGSGSGGGGDPVLLPAVVVTAQRLDAARASIETQTGASAYTIDQSAITASPGGANVPLNQLLLQAPDVTQDSFGQLHVRGDHNDLQYRLNGIILPEGISVFGQTLDPRLISSMALVTGALPAEYGLRTAGIVDITTKSGLMQPGGSASLYGGSHGTFEPSGWYGGSAGNLSFFASADLLRNDLGIEAPDAGATPLHDHSAQIHAFGYAEDILDADDRLSLVLGAANQRYQIPNQRGAQPGGISGITGLGPGGVLQVNGQTTYPSAQLNEIQHELTQYAILSWQHAAGDINWQSSLSARYSKLDFQPDWTGDLLYDGLAQYARKGDTALGWQTDGAWRIDDAHTLRAGLYLQHDVATSDTTSQVLPTDAAGNQLADLPQVIVDNGARTQWITGAYLQDEWRILAPLTLNYGLRFDRYDAYSSGSQLSPRANLVWELPADVTFHAGFARYFTPPPFELVANETFTKFSGTTALPPGGVTRDDAPQAERADYYDVGLEQRLLDRALTLGIDGFWRTSQHLLDEGQFGAPIVLTPFNYRYGQIGGVEFTANYSARRWSAYGNFAVQSAKGKSIESSQFNFAPDELAYIADHYIHLDHEERICASAGASLLVWADTRASVDLLFGTGLRQSLTLGNGDVIPNGDHTASYTQVNLGLTHDFPLPGGKLTVRLDLINALDDVYLIRSGSGIGVFAPQYAARRGVFAGIAKDF